MFNPKGNYFMIWFNNIFLYVQFCYAKYPTCYNDISQGTSKKTVHLWFSSHMYSKTLDQNDDHVHQPTAQEEYHFPYHCHTVSKHRDNMPWYNTTLIILDKTGNFTPFVSTTRPTCMILIRYGIHVKVFFSVTLISKFLLR